MLRKLLVSGIAISLINSSFGQDSTKPASLSVTASADLYYKYDFGKTAANTLTSFTASHNRFELGMASVKLDYKSTKTEFVADLGFGKRAQEFSYNDEGILQAVKQLYVSYSPKEWLKLTAGEWATHVGYELVDAYANRNYSMSYMFTNGPFFHTGVKAEATLGANGFMVGLADPTDFKYVPGGVVNRKAYLAQYSYAPTDRFKAYLNFVSNENIDSLKSVQYDLVLTSKLNDKWSLAYNGTVNCTKTHLGKEVYADTKNWWASAVYVNFDPTKTFGLTLREEYFNDDNRLKMFGALPKGGSVLASTLSANLRVDHFTFIPEFRWDHASQSLFTDSKGKAVKQAANVLLAAVYQF